MTVFIIMVVVFVLGYTAIALEHPLKIDKAAPALLIGAVLWGIYALWADTILSLDFSAAWTAYKAAHGGHVDHHAMIEFITEHQVLHHLAEISTILFFLMGAMTIVEIIDQHQGFKIITDRIQTMKKIKLLWILSVLTFFMSAMLDNLTTTIVMVALLSKLIDDKKTRWFFASMIVLAANAGGAWSPIGDVTTIMLWIGKQVTTLPIITNVIFPSLVAMIVPLVILSFTIKGNVERPKDSGDKDYTKPRERWVALILGVSSLLFVPVFKTFTHLPPYLGMLQGLAVMWLVTEVMHRRKNSEIKRRLLVAGVLKKVDMPTIFFFLGILSAVAALQSAGHLNLVAAFLDEHLQNIYAIDLAIGALSAIVDNVPLVAGAMGMYPTASDAMVQSAANPEFMQMFVQDGQFWQFLAYTAGTGGSMLIIGSAAGVAAMGLEKIDFIWYMKKISWLAIIGYLAGAAAYIFQENILFG